MFLFWVILCSTVFISRTHKLNAEFEVARFLGIVLLCRSSFALGAFLSLGRCDNQKILIVLVASDVSLTLFKSSLSLLSRGPSRAERGTEVPLMFV